MSNKKNGIAALVRELIEDTVVSLGYEIWDVEYVKEGAFMYLRITIDSERGIDLDDCEAVSTAISPMIDEADPIEEQYFLEVSSPGVERELKRPEHFEMFMGATVECKLYTAVNGAKQYIGDLLKYDKDAGILVISVDDNEIELELKNISKVNIYYDFDQDDLEDMK